MVAKSSANNYLLIIAGSGRMLASSARRAGYLPLVIDRFGDCDTEQLAVQVRVVEQLTVKQLQPVVDELTELYSVKDLVYGSGLETRPDSLEWLASRFKILGNAPATLNQIGDRQQFFATLRDLHISFPETRFQAPRQDFNPWLVKPYRGEGGYEVRRYQPGEAEQQQVYWQRFQEGQPYSVLFAANGRDAAIIGINRQWVCEHLHGQAFVFSGVVNCPVGIERHKYSIYTWVKKLTREYALTGLNGIDFIVQGDQCRLLEINPRPPASLVLYDEDYEKGLLDLHINACNGRLINSGQARSRLATAYQIIYATETMIMPVDFDWPQWTSDRPRSGSIIHTQQPICSIIAAENNVGAVVQTLRRRTERIYHLLNHKGAFSTCNTQPASINYLSL